MINQFHSFVKDNATKARRWAVTAQDGQTRLTNIDVPLRWKRLSRVEVMSDLFHEDVPFDFIGQVFAVMAMARQHTFQVLTKRPARMLEFMRTLRDGCILDVPFEAGTRLQGAYILPLSNVWLGVSVEDQKTADERIPWLLRTPAAVRWLSCEPLLGPIDLDRAVFNPSPFSWEETRHPRSRPIDWVVVGGESGPHARPMRPDWAQSLRDQCRSAGVPFFFKQWGEIVPSGQWRPETLGHPLGELAYQAMAEALGDRTAPRVYHDDGSWGYRVGKKAAGRLLDGREWNEYPQGMPA